MQRWEVWKAWVPFEEDPDILKPRPVLIIDNNEIFILSFKMTGTAPRENFIGEYRLNDWREAGLTKPTTVRLSKLLRLNRNAFIKKYGRLSNLDKSNIENLIRNNFSNIPL